MADMGGVRFVSEDKTDRIIGVVIALCMTAIVAIALLSACSTGDAESGDASTKRDVANEIAVAEFYRERNGIADVGEGE